MVKVLSSTLLADIQSVAGTFATCLDIVRDDGKVYHITSHDVPITFEGTVYTNTSPFTHSDIASSIQRNADNVDISLVPDEVTLFHADFQDRLFDRAAMTLFEVNFEDSGHGRNILRRGWAGTFDTNELGIVKFTLLGMLKRLDTPVGHLYTPGCTADLGDSRCKFAVNRGQHYSLDNIYRNGDWVFNYDENRMTNITATNLGFSAGAGANSATGWVFSTSAHLRGGASSGVSGATPYPGESAALWGDRSTALTTPIGTEHFCYQDIDLVASGMTPSQLDAGAYSFRFTAKLIQTDINTPLRMRVQVLSATGEILETNATSRMTLDAPFTWRERALVFPLIAGARTARIQLIMLQQGSALMAAFSKVRVAYWNHTVNDPFHGVVHKLERLANFGKNARYRAKNYRFSNGLTSWVIVDGNWIVDNTDSFFTSLAPGRPVPPVTVAAVRSGTIYQDINLLTGAKLPVKSVEKGAMVGYVFFDVYARLSSAGVYPSVTTSITFLSASNAVLSTVSITSGKGFKIPTLARSLRFTFTGTEAPLTSTRSIAFTNTRFFFYNKDKPISADPETQQGRFDTAFTTAVGGTTVDGGLIWTAAKSAVLYDTVSAPIDGRTFAAATLPAGDGYYQTAEIKWLSGANAGQKNIIRTWDGDTNRVRLYYDGRAPISVGDRFMVVSPCQKRFVDCKSKFNNAVNFRGFPHIPSKIVDPVAPAATRTTTNTPSVNPVTSLPVNVRKTETLSSLRHLPVLSLTVVDP
jgi:hypothetical protein